MRLARLALLLLAVSCSRPQRTIVPWAWERRESLRNLPVTEVAFLAGTISSRGARLEIRPRMQPLVIPPGAKRDPVWRIETRRDSFDRSEIDAVVEGIARVARLSHATLVQIDFDATRSQRPLYAALLRELRRALPPTTRISITALASWCMDDRWLGDLPVDEAVPMLFRMGPDGGAIRRRLGDGDFAERRCRGSAGFATDEPLVPIRNANRIYIFHPRPWSDGALRAAQQEIERW